MLLACWHLPPPFNMLSLISCIKASCSSHYDKSLVVFWLVHYQFTVQIRLAPSHIDHCGLYFEHDVFETFLETKDKAASELSLLTPEVEMDLRFILERNLKEIIKKYAAYVDCAVEKKEVSPIELRFYLLSISAFCSGSCNGQRFALVSDEHELKSCATITDIFAFLTTKCASFLNYDIFQDIIKKYDIATDRSELNYPQYVNEYIEKHKVSEFMKINPLLKPKNGSETLTLKYDVDYTCKLAKISELKNSLAEILDLHPSALHIIDIEEGCIVVTFHILASVAKAIFVHERVFTSQQKNAFHAASVLWLKCNGYTFNFKESDKKEVNESQGKNSYWP